MQTLSPLLYAAVLVLSVLVLTVTLVVEAEAEAPMVTSTTAAVAIARTTTTGFTTATIQRVEREIKRKLQKCEDQMTGRRHDRSCEYLVCRWRGVERVSSAIQIGIATTRCAHASSLKRSFRIRVH